MPVVNELTVNLRPAIGPSTDTSFDVVVPGSFGVSAFSFFFGNSNALTFTGARAYRIAGANGSIAISDHYFLAPGSQQLFQVWSANASANYTRLSVLLEPILVKISISPTSAVVDAGGTQQFTATVTGTPNTAVTWNATYGAIDINTGLYEAPDDPHITEDRVWATSVADPTKVAYATVIIKTGGPPPPDVDLRPVAATLILINN
jgi:hypothetical protein